MCREVCRNYEDLYEMESLVDMYIRANGYICDDGHHLTEDEYRQWTHGQMLEVYHQVFETDKTSTIKTTDPRF